MEPLHSKNGKERRPEKLKRLAVVTGAGRGIGAAVAKELAERGYGLIINARNEERLLLKAGELEAYGGIVVPVAGDIGDPETSERIFSEAERLTDSFDELVLVNNAGISSVGLIQDLDIEAWHELIETNLSSVFYTVRKAVPIMLARKRGHIVNISSVWGQAGASCEAAYSASKGGVDAFTKALAKELAPSNIQVNALSLGAMDTDMNSCFSDEEKELIASEIPAGRFGRPEEAAEACAYLCECGPYLTGQIIRLDGAWI